jgi:N-acetylglucosamine-6-sulfatase
VPDGRSFVSLLNSEPPDTDSWRRRFMVEHWQVPTVKGLWPATTNRALRGTGYMYNRYLNGERELYNLYEDPFELTNQYPSMSGARKEQLDGLWEDLVQCKGVECKKAEN